jgi:hypothetical protein
MSTFYNDGSFVNFGTAVIPITGINNVLLGNYVAESININFPSEVIEIRNQQNALLGQIGISGFIGGSATVQCGTTGSILPHNGCTFGLYNNVYFVSEVGDTRTQGDIAKSSLTFRKKYN